MKSYARCCGLSALGLAWYAEVNNRKWLLQGFASLSRESLATHILDGYSTRIPTTFDLSNLNHGDRIDCAVRACLPKAATYLRKREIKEDQDQELKGRQGWQKMVQGRWFRIQDAKDCH